MAKTLREQLIGAWKLVSYVEKPVDGSDPIYPMGEKLEGTIMYTPDGYMSVQMMQPGRAKFASGDWLRGTEGAGVERRPGQRAAARTRLRTRATPRASVRSIPERRPLPLLITAAKLAEDDLHSRASHRSVLGHSVFGMIRRAEFRCRRRIGGL
jgi:hypothetical protein